MSLALTLLLAVTFALAGRQSPAPVAADAPQPLPPIATKAPRFYKGNLHTHSLWSDGDDFPEMIADWYKRHGYDFLALTDHNVLSDGERWLAVAPEKKSLAGAIAKYEARFGPNWVERRDRDGKMSVRLKPLREFRSLLEEPGTFLLIQGEEITHRYAKLPVHLNGINVRDVIKPTDGGNVGETITVNLRAVAEQRKKTGWPMLAFLNHPNFGWGVVAADMLKADDLRFFEVFNGHPGVRNYGDATHASCEKIWDTVLAVRLAKLKLPVVYGLATDDSHGYHEFGQGKVNPGRGWVMVRAPYLSAEAMVRGLEAGDFYSSSGVILDDVQRAGNELRIDIRAESGVTYSTRFIATMNDAAIDPTGAGAGIGRVVAESTDLQPRYQLTGKELYVRAVVTSSKPHPNPYQKGDKEMAWTQPVVP
jgi:hypothetical protein